MVSADIVSKATDAGLSICFLENELMKNHTTFQIGGPVELMAIPKDRKSLIGLFRLLAEAQTSPVYIMGNGSNLLVSDEGIDGIVVKTEDALKDLNICGTVITAGAGVSLARISTFAKENSLSGFEFAHGIPGTLGGAVYMNAGAYDGEMKSVVTKTEYLKNNTIEALLDDNHQFTYRHSFFSDHPECFILSSQISLHAGQQDEITAKIADFSNRRREKQPLNYPSAGSVFKRPTGYFAGKLIQDVGLSGYMIGGAQVSEKHAGFIINREGATCRDVLDLIKLIKITVYDRFSIQLECEVKVIGRNV
ncbi:MAG: UDP-N-acetylmuramate dehydrogenase [Clostridiales bacterium]|nr:UDP-N-acetylmuramate dehydrogenase [Clostridiales bacterium]